MGAVPKSPKATSSARSPDRGRKNVTGTVLPLFPHLALDTPTNWRSVPLSDLTADRSDHLIEHRFRLSETRTDQVSSRY
jgi:hypothetical protein